ncbi:hypothetical protein GE09DRAFT_632164 [Coniochaeta sp. 2T2.1]|nr:hypothetical protein GE09DRAFT_632164 [Coniochaeta sp. 2T2.1]
MTAMRHEERTKACGCWLGLRLAVVIASGRQSRSHWWNRLSFIRIWRFALRKDPRICSFVMAVAGMSILPSGREGIGADRVVVMPFWDGRVSACGVDRLKIWVYFVLVASSKHRIGGRPRQLMVKALGLVFVLLFRLSVVEQADGWVVRENTGLRGMNVFVYKKQKRKKDKKGLTSGYDLGCYV